MIQRGPLGHLNPVELGTQVVEPGAELGDRSVDALVELGRRRGALLPDRLVLPRRLLANGGELSLLVLVQRRPGLRERLCRPRERSIAHATCAVQGALPALLERAQALSVCGVEVAPRLVGDLVHRGVVRGTTLAHLLDLLVALLGELVAIRLPDLLGGVGLGLASIVGERPIEEAVIAIDLVTAVLGGALRGHADGVRAGGGRGGVERTLGLRVQPADLTELASLRGSCCGGGLPVRRLDLGAPSRRRVLRVPGVHRRP